MKKQTYDPNNFNVFDEIETIECEEQTKITLTLNLSGLKRKLNSSKNPKDSILIAKEKKNSNTITLSFNEIINKMVTGSTWFPSLYKVNRNKSKTNKLWEASQIIGLDFDNGITPEIIKNNLYQIGVIPNIIYSTFSDKPSHRKFRVVIILNEIITDKVLYKSILNWFKHVFDNVDKATFDLARMFFGGTKLIYQDSSLNKTTFIKELIMNDLETNLTKKAQKYPSGYIYYNQVGKNAKKVLSSQKTLTNLEWLKLLKENDIDIHPIHNIVRRFNWEYAIENNKELNAFVNSHLSYHKLLYIVRNLLWINGGEKFLKDTIKLNNSKGISHYNKSDIQLIKNLKQSKYNGNLEFFKECKPEKDYIIHQLREPLNKITLKEAEMKLENFFTEILNSNDTNIHIIKVPTGLGKTRLLENIENKNMVLAFPNHSLKDEVSNRIKNASHNNKFVTTPEFPELSDRLMKEVNYLYQVGLSDEVSTLLTKTLKDRNSNEIDKENIKQYRNSIKLAYKGNVNVITTHQMTQFVDFKQDTIIYDEDPFQNIIKMGTLKGSDLITLVKSLKNSSSLLSSFVNMLLERLKSNIGVYFYNNIKATSKTKDVLVKELLKNKTYSSAIISAIFSEVIYMDIDPKDDFSNLMNVINNSTIHFTTKHNLKSNKKIIILSATASEQIYKELYGDRVKFYSIDNVETKGRIIQDTRYTYSQSSLNNIKGYSVKHIKKELPNENIPVLTFSKQLGKFKNPIKDMYFGKLTGFDTYKGEDIAVVGTPYYPEWSYMLLAMSLSKTTEIYHQHGYTKQEIEYGGYKFNINTFQDPLLRSLQLEMVTSELIQAIGRARILRENCTVYLFSRIPIEGAEQKYVRKSGKIFE